jgi:hypothetical protein
MSAANELCAYVGRCCCRNVRDLRLVFDSIDVILLLAEISRSFPHFLWENTEIIIQNTLQMLPL